MRKLLITILACLPMLGLADFRMQTNPNSVTLVNLTEQSFNFDVLSGKCLKTNINLNNTTLYNVLHIPMTTVTFANAQGICEEDKPIQLTLSVGSHGPWGVVSLEFEHGRLGIGKNLRTLHATNGISFSFERNRTQNIIYIHDLD